jgi:hypothetical protein
MEKLYLETMNALHFDMFLKVEKSLKIKFNQKKLPVLNRVKMFTNMI